MMKHIVSITLKILIGLNALGLTGCSSFGAVNVPTPALTPTSAPIYVVTASPTLLPFTGKIAFVSYDNMDNPHINVMNANGSDLVDITPVTNPPQKIEFLSWSPDGQYIIFQARKDDVMQIFTIRSDGSDFTQLTSGKDNSYSPSWSPNEQYIAFAARKDGVMQIYKIKSDGSGVIQLTFGKNGDSFRPLWSPDGKNIIFKYSNPDILDSTGLPGASQAYIMNSDGTEAHHLAVKTKPDNAIMTGSYRKDGLIAIEEVITRYAVANYVVNSEGEIQKQFPEFSTESPIVWSPDGKYVAYSPGYRVPGCFGIVVMKFDKSENKCLIDQKSDSSVYFGQTSWSPDGKYIMFLSNLNGDYDLYAMRPDGSGLTQLTNIPGHEDWAVWWSEP